MKRRKSTIDEHGCWGENEKDLHVFDKKLMSALYLLYKNINSIIDIGCGDGTYTRIFNELGINCKGFDGNPYTGALTRGQCFTKDFSAPINIGPFDLVLSLEVGEHIPKKYEQIFLDNLVNASKKYICLSWALPGQWGTGHCNPQTNEYIINELEKRSFNYDLVSTLQLREIAKLNWFKKTIMCFEK